MAGPGISVLCLADTSASEMHPVFNHVAPYGYLLPNMYLFITYIESPYSLLVVVGLGLVSTSPAFVKSSASHPAGPHSRLDKRFWRCLLFWGLCQCLWCSLCCMLFVCFL